MQSILIYEYKLSNIYTCIINRYIIFKLVHLHTDEAAFWLLT